MLVRNELHELKSEAQVIRNESQKRRNETQVIRNTLLKPDEKICMPIIENNKTDNDLFEKCKDDDLGFDDNDVGFDDDELKELIEQDLDIDIDIEDEMIEDKIDNDKIEDKIDDDRIEDMIKEKQEGKIEDKERTMCLDKINEQIDHVNQIARIRNDFSKNIEEVFWLMNELQDVIYNDNSWLRLVELNKINVLLDDSLDYMWKTIYCKNRDKHEKINIGKDKDIDGYVSKYINIVNDKLELVNRIRELLDSTMIDIQNEIGMINEVKQASEIDIYTLKLMHNTLTKILKKWRDIVLEMINRDNVCSKPKDTKNKDTKKQDTKMKDAKKKDTKKKDDKPKNTKKKDNKPKNTKKKDEKPDTKKKDNKPDTSKNYIENRASNRN